MKPEDWLRLTAFIKVRNKLTTWTREDLIAYANQEFDSINLTKQQVSMLCEKLKQKKLEKPGKQFYIATSVVERIAPVEFRMVENPGNFNWPVSSWYRSNGYVSLRFSSLISLVSWVFTLIEQNPRFTWNEIQKNWKKRNKIANFIPETGTNYIIDNSLQKVLQKVNYQNNILRTPLPDNADIKKQYWGLDVGDSLVKENSKLEVVEVRANLDTPPTITFKRVDENELV